MWHKDMQNVPFKMAPLSSFVVTRRDMVAERKAAEKPKTIEIKAENVVFETPFSKESLAEAVKFSLQVRASEIRQVFYIPSDDQDMNRWTGGGIMPTPDLGNREVIGWKFEEKCAVPIFMDSHATCSRYTIFYGGKDEEFAALVKGWNARLA